MQRRLTYAPRARNDLESVRSWLTQPGSGQAARRKLRAIVMAIEAVQQHPYRFPSGPHPGVRELFCAGGYQVFYRITPDNGLNESAGLIRVLRIYGPGQDRDGVAAQASFL